MKTCLFAALALTLLAGCAPFPRSTPSPTARDIRAQERATLIATAVSGIRGDCSHALDVPTWYPPQDAPGPTGFTTTQLIQIRECMEKIDWFAGQGNQAFFWNSISAINMNNRKRIIDFPYYPTKPGIREAMEAALTRVKVPLAAVDIHGCPIGEPYTPRHPEPETQALRQALDFRVSVPPKAHPPEPFPLALVLKNISPETIRLEYSPAFGIVITDAAGNMVWDSTCNRYYPLIALVKDLVPNEEFTLPIDWAFADNQSNEVPPGSYSVYGFVRRDWPSPPATITVLP